ncbi:MAG: hypothetical protein CMJ64_09450 [Planctomycetaceae bacterium]|nr:hypothetical protein [Planctomycetaceae bacterium]
MIPAVIRRFTHPVTNIDQFESVFKAADKPRFSREPIDISKVVLVSDLDEPQSRLLEADIQEFLGNAVNRDARWELLSGNLFTDVASLIDLVSTALPDLICTYRNLNVPAPDYPYSLGGYVDVLTQATDVPVLLLPNPRVYPEHDFAKAGRDSVMAITDHLTGDHHLVSYAAKLTEAAGKLFLTHVEDEATFEHYIRTISKIPAIDTDTAREEILEQLLQEPHDYIKSCRTVLEEGTSLHIEEIVTVGHRLADYKRLIEEHDVNLLVLNTKDEDQLAMHGLAYPLAVELRQLPLLLL